MKQQQLILTWEQIVSLNKSVGLNQATLDECHSKIQNRLKSLTIEREISTNFLNDIHGTLNGYNNLRNELLKIMNLSYDDSSLIEFIPNNWICEENTLHINDCIVDNSNDFYNSDYYNYNISSLASKGNTLYKGETNGYTIVMAYPEEGNWDDTTIFILDNKLEIKS
jgi:hypothetical protein